MQKELTKRLKKLQEMEARMEQFLKRAPEGKLRCAINKGCYQYYIGNQYQDKTKIEYVKKLAKKEYYQQTLKEIEKQRVALEKLVRTMEQHPLERVYERMHPARKRLVEPEVKPVADIIREFEQMEYEGKGFTEEDTTAYYTIKGERVRSKSEKIIADTFERKGIPYQYEMPLQLRYRNKNITIYPDFTVLNKQTGKKYIFEHFGMMDKQAYYENALMKLDTYEKNGILLGDGLIITHETAGRSLDTNVLEEYIERYLC